MAIGPEPQAVPVEPTGAQVVLPWDSTAAAASCGELYKTLMQNTQAYTLSIGEIAPGPLE